jgi:hypothetical protein
MSLRTEAFRDDPRRLAVLYGPLVLCAPVESGSPAPAVVCGDGPIVGHIRPVADKPLTFAASPEVFRLSGSPAGGPRELVPLYREYRRPYVVYWDVLSEAQWSARQAEIQAGQARRKALDARTVDRVAIGEEPSERAHALAGEKTGAGEFGSRQWRHAVDGGWFSYQLALGGGRPLALLCTYWGSDSGPRQFDILVDGRKIATEKLDNNRPDQLYDQVYRIGAELTRGKAKITVRFQGHPGNMAGGVFDCRLVAVE